jgi:3-isopropylmalate/(R)-2-methylmalate dehydratase large subunit
MGMTIIEKILARASNRSKVAPGDLVVVDIDTSLLVDPNFHPGAWREPVTVPHPHKIVVIYDHRVPAVDHGFAEAQAIGREWAQRWGVNRFHDVGPDGGISHVVATEWAYALPGTVLVCSDSHTCSSGAWNCAARGVGLTEMLYAICTGKTWFKIGETVRYDFEGRLADGVTTKDVFLHIAGTFGDHVNQNVEFGGPGMSGLSLNARRTLSTMGAELSAEFAVFEPDEVLLEYVRQKSTAPFTPQFPDKDAHYEARRRIDLPSVEPMVALPDSVVGNSMPVSTVKGERVDQAFIGSCANGSLDDFALAARVLEGRRVAAGTRLIVTPGSQAVYRAAVKAGYVEILAEAGAIVTNATCGACSGGHLGVLGPNETCITASTRNFKGRMGSPSARIFMASAATVAASAIAGEIIHPGKFMRGTGL